MGRKKCFQGIMVTSTNRTPLIKLGQVHILTKESGIFSIGKMSAENGQQGEPLISFASQVCTQKNEKVSLSSCSQHQLISLSTSILIFIHLIYDYVTSLKKRL